MNRFKNVLHRIILFKDWHELVFPFNRFGGASKTLHLRNGAVLAVEDIYSSDFGIIMEIFDQDMYRLKSLELPANATVFDLGANIGIFSVAAHNLFPTARIVAYEPHPTSFKFLQKNAPFATCIKQAVAEREGDFEIERGGISGERGLVSSGGIPVHGVSLDEALASYARVDLLKVDVEGSEKGIFSGASDATMKKVQRAVVEIDETDKAWFETFFKQHGFSTWESQPRILHATRTI